MSQYRSNQLYNIHSMILYRSTVKACRWCDTIIMALLYTAATTFSYQFVYLCIMPFMTQFWKCYLCCIPSMPIIENVMTISLYPRAT